MLLLVVVVDLGLLGMYVCMCVCMYVCMYVSLLIQAAVIFQIWRLVSTVVGWG